MTNEEFIKSISLEGEEWRDVAGYEGRYIVSSYGRIASLAFDIITHPYGKEHILHRDAHLLTSTPFKTTQYLYVMFRKDGKRYKYSTHRLVALAFLPNPDNLPQIDHINGDRSDNRVSNLQWCDATTNMANPITQKRVKEGRSKTNRQYQVPVVCLKDGIVIKQYDSAYDTRHDGFNPRHVGSCCSGIRNTHLGFQWMYLSDYEASINKSKNA